VKRPLSIVIILLFLSAIAQAQKITPTDLRILHKKEDSLKVLARQIFTDSLDGGRMRSDSQFVRTLIRSLQIKNSFYYPFDSVQGISKLYAPDSTFRIITWQLVLNNFFLRKRGAIQYHTADGSLRLVPLRDISEFTDDPKDSVRTKDNWVGAVYYNMIETKYNGKSYYTLFGYDIYSPQSNRKWIEVLSFDNRGMPVFGGPFFTFPKDSLKRPDQYRFNIEYKKEAATTVNYNPDAQMIVYDHLISETNEPDNPWTFIPDGDYEGFQWQKGKWVHVDKVYNQKLEDGQFPMPDPLKDANGNNNEEKLKAQTEKNRARKGQ
jgi:hypothetical protein